MTTERCDCCDLPAYSCGKAAEDRERQEEAILRARLLTAGWIEAVYQGQCGRCSTWFGAGALIQGGPYGWISECCADAAS